MKKPVIKCFNSSAATFTGSGLTSDPKDLFFKSCTLSTTGHWIGAIRRKRKKSESPEKKDFWCWCAVPRVDWADNLCAQVPSGALMTTGEAFGVKKREVCLLWQAFSSTDAWTYLWSYKRPLFDGRYSLLSLVTKILMSLFRDKYAIVRQTIAFPKMASPSLRKNVKKNKHRAHSQWNHERIIWVCAVCNAKPNYSQT